MKTKILFLSVLIFSITAIATNLSFAQEEMLEQALFKPLQEKIEQAKADQVDFYAPQNFGRAIELYQAAKNDFKEGARLSRIREQISQANELLDQAFESTRISKVALEQVVAMRNRMLEAGFNEAAPGEMNRAERFFQRTIEKAEQGDIRSARAETEKVFEHYRLATIKWIQESLLEKAAEDIKRLQEQLDPEVYRSSLRQVDELTEIVASYKKEEFDPFSLRDDIRVRIEDIKKPLYPPFYQNLPDTLLIGEFVLITDRYSNKGNWDFFNKRATGVSGTAWTKFQCSSVYLVTPIFPETGLIQTKKVYHVVEKVYDEANQIDLADARLIDRTAQPGQMLEVNLKVKQLDYQGILASKRDLIGKLKLQKKGEILLHFDNATIEPVPGRTNVGRMVQGMAAYPATPAVPKKIKLNVSGFTALIDTLTLTPINATANIDLEFPWNTSSGAGCQPPSVSLGVTEITPRCEFYVEKLTDSFGPFFLDETGIKIAGTGFVADFHSAKSYTGMTPAQKSTWMGMIFLQGKTIEQPEFNPSNTGYCYGSYVFYAGTLTAWGFDADLKLTKPWSFASLAPLDFYITLATGRLKFSNSRIETGSFSGKMVLPKTVVTPQGSQIIASFTSLKVNKFFDLAGEVILEDELRWGGFGLVSRKGNFRLVGMPREFFSPVDGDSFKTSFFTATALDTLSGLTVKMQMNDTLFVYSPDSKRPLPFSDQVGVYGWLNLEQQGVSGYFHSIEEMTILKASLGKITSKYYRADSSFATTFRHSLKDSMWVRLWFAGNASFDADLGGKFDLAYPSAPSKKSFFSPPFRKMGVTSTASFAGGTVAFSDTKTLGYWGVGITSKRGVVSVKEGEIVYTNADIYEPVHFARGFNILWGEMLADGDLGKFYFNYNCAGQKFDGIPVTLDSAALSKYDPRKTGDKLGSLVVRGDLHFNFFGTPDTLVTITDTKFLNHAGKPFRSRVISIAPHEFELQRYWGSKLAFMDFDSVGYDSLDQNGFTGDGNVDLNFFKNSPLNASIVIDSSSISICITETASHTLYLPPSDLTTLAQIWGCIYIKGDELKRIVVGGRMEATTGGGFDILLPQAGFGVEVKMAVTPVLTKFIAEGMMYLSIGLPGSMEVQGRVSLTCNRKTPSLSGDIWGKFNFDALVIGGANAEGQVNWNLEPLRHYLQGRVTVNLFSLKFGAGASAGIYIGMNAPKSKAWVLQDEDGKFGINMKNLPDYLTGVYIYGDVDFSISFYGIISGGVEIYAGVGAFTSSLVGTEKYGVPGVLPYVMGNIGIYLHGELLWGVVSASAWGNLQLMGPYPFYFEGTIGLEGCALWVFCASIDVTAGLSSSRGFYIE